MFINNAGVRCRLQSLWSYSELGLTNHSAFLNVAILYLTLLSHVDREIKCAIWQVAFASQTLILIFIYSPIV